MCGFNQSWADGNNLDDEYQKVYPVHYVPEISALFVNKPKY